MANAITKLCQRSASHDQSKYSDEELDLVCGKERLDALEYRSEEYKAALVEVMDAVSHHYRANPHHPEHFANGVDGMSLFDLLEMLCDWKAAGETSGGDIWNSIEVNEDRFSISPQLVDILKNTATEMGWARA